MPRKATLAILIWTGVMFLWYLAWQGNVNELPTATSDAEEVGRAIGAGLSVTFLFFIWFVGFIILSIVWFMSRPKNNVAVYGPQGQQVMVSEKEARKRVEKQGWAYQPPPAYPPQQPYPPQYPPQPPYGGPPPPPAGR